MGGTTSHEEKKTVDSTGEVNNNVVVQETVDVYSSEMVILLSILCILKIIELGCYLYTTHNRNLKKKYSQSQGSIV